PLAFKFEADAPAAHQARPGRQRASGITTYAFRLVATATLSVRPRCTIVSTNDFLSSHRSVKQPVRSPRSARYCLPGERLATPGRGRMSNADEPAMLDSAGAGRHPIVLIASHQESSSRSLESILGPNGYTVVKAYTAAQTLERARRAQPDAIILDATLPDQDPLEICRALRHDPEFAPDTPIIILISDHATRQQRIDALRAGACRAAGRVSDAIGRLGPTEFAVVASGTDAGGAVRLAERLANAVMEGPRDTLSAPSAQAGAAAPFRLRAGYYVVPDAHAPAADPADT